jgi:3-oxoacyl-[acyl-carrier protein] reductase
VTNPGRRLRDRVVLVTGASEGIGLGIAQAAVEQGASVVVTGRRADRLEEAAAALGSAALPVVADVSDAEANQRVVDAAMARFGRLDVVVNNAALVPPPGAMLDLADATLEAVWRVNVMGPVQLVRAAYDAHLGAHGGTVINIGSLGGLELQPGMGAYSLAKAALHHLTRFLAAELGPQVRVNAIAPGPVHTPGADPVWDALGDRAVRLLPTGRLGSPTDVAAVALFLMDDCAGWITGETFVVDGGASVQNGRRPTRRNP